MSRVGRRFAGVVLLVGLLATAGCGRSADPAVPGTTAAMPGMAGPMPAGPGTSASSLGYTFVLAATTVPAATAGAFAFRITGPDGRTVTWFQRDQTKFLHLYLIRADLSGFAHLHPTMATDGTWSVGLPALAPGAYRAYATFLTPDAQGKPMAFVLSHPLTVPGPVAAAPLPAAAPAVDVDGYTLTLAGAPAAGAEGPLTLTVTNNGRPVTDLESYLDTYAHLSAFHAGDLAFAHLHPRGVVTGAGGGPTLTFDADFPAAGLWRLYVQFQTAGTLHTAAFTVSVS